ncbi:MAG: rhodanese-like domain-containing protein, partial [Caldilineaceae bacterium]
DLRAIGVDRVDGYFGPDVVQHNTQPLPVITADELGRRLARNGMMLLDVRGRSEFAEGHLPGAINVPLGYLAQRLGEIPHDNPVVTYCASGYRSQIGASLLQAAGFSNAMTLNEGVEGWSKLLAQA